MEIIDKMKQDLLKEVEGLKSNDPSIMQSFWEDIENKIDKVFDVEDLSEVIKNYFNSILVYEVPMRTENGWQFCSPDFMKRYRKVLEEYDIFYNKDTNNGLVIVDKSARVGRDAFAIVSGTGKVSTFGRSTVLAYEDATVFANQNSIVIINGRVDVFAKERSLIQGNSIKGKFILKGRTLTALTGSPIIEASEDAKLIVKSDEATISLSGDSNCDISGMSVITAKDYAIVHHYQNKPENITISGNASIVDKPLIVNKLDLLKEEI